MSRRKLIKGITLLLAVLFIFLNIVPGTLAFLMSIAEPIVNIFELKQALPPDIPDPPSPPNPPGPGTEPDTETETDKPTDTDTETDKPTDTDTDKPTDTDSDKPTDTDSESTTPPEEKTGALIINKLVDHPYSADYVYPEDLKFDFEVALGVANAYKTFPSTRGELKADEYGKLYFSISPDKSYTVEGIPDGTTVSVTEKGNKSGFTVVGAATQKITVGQTENILTFVNAYTPTAFDFGGASGLDLVGVKVLEGREWQEGDTFRFILERRVGESWVKIGASSITYSPENKSFNAFDFSEALSNMRIDNIGTYYFRISEEIGSIDYISYDKTVNYFELKISDNDMDGGLELLNSGVSVHNNISVGVSETTGKRMLKVTFNNTYDPPPRPADLNVFVTASNIILGDVDGILSADMFEFVVESVKSGDLFVQKAEKNGRAVFAITFTADDIGVTKHYRMYQQKGNIENVTYSNVAYDIYITVALGDDNRLVATVLSNGVEYSDFVGEFETVYRKPSVVDPPVSVDEKVHVWPLIVDGAIVAVIATGWTAAAVINNRRIRKKLK